MFKKLVFFSLGFTTAFSLAMEKPHQEWLRKRKEIIMSSQKGSLIIPIVDSTTVLDIKKQMKKRSGIPIYMQKIDAEWTNWWTLNYIKNSATLLTDDAHIKNDIELHNTYVFRLFLQSRRQVQAENGN
jgi:hypothetical protein